jgi:hypothetical protein
MLKSPEENQRDTSKAKFMATSRYVFLLRYEVSLQVTVTRASVDKSGMIRIQMRKAKQTSNGRSGWDALCNNTP